MKRNVFSKIAILFVLLTLIFPQGALAQGENPPIAEKMTSLQETLKAQFAEREAAGEPVPSVSYEYVVQQPAPSPYSAASAPQEDPTTVATTIIEYDNPQQAGYDAWPSLDPEGSQTHFDELYYNQMEELIPGFWELYEFGQEPRRMTYVETIQLTAPLPSQMPRPMEPLAHTSTEDILMGFTFAGPSLDKTLTTSYEACFTIIFYGDVCGTIYNFEAGVRLNVALGLRLPAEVTLSGPTQMDLASTFDFSATLTTYDWTDEQYASYNLESLDGKEFVLSVGYFLGVKLEIAGVDFCQAISAGAWGCYAEQGIDESADFETPLGIGSSFPIPPGKIPVKEWGLGTLFDNGKKDGNNQSEISEEEYNILDELFNVAVGVQLTPDISSTDISAHWETVGEVGCASSGTLHFTASGDPVTVGPVNVCNETASDEATIRLSDIRYNLTKFELKFGTYLDFTVAGFDVPLSYDFFTVDISQLTQAAGLYFGQHYQCAWQDIAHPFVCGPTDPDNILELNMGMSLSASDHDFGSQLFGTPSAANSFTITNTGNDILRVGTLSINGAFALINNTCSNAEILPNETCSFSVTYIPSAYGMQTGSVTISNNVPGNPDMITLSGTGVSIPEGYNLLGKPDFGGLYVLPYPWMPQGIAPPYTPALDCRIFLSPGCSVKLTGVSNITKAITQILNRTGSAGDTYQFGLSSRAQKVPTSGGQYKVIVLFYNELGVLVGSSSLQFTRGTHNWETMSAYYTVPADYSRIRVRFLYQHTSGAVGFDDAFLIQQP